MTWPLVTVTVVQRLLPGTRLFPVCQTCPSLPEGSSHYLPKRSPQQQRDIHARDESRAIGGFWTLLKGWDPLTGSSFLLKYRIPTPMLQSFLLTKVTRKAGVFFPLPRGTCSWQ